MTCNANRLIDDDLMRDAVDEMRQRRVHIVIWTETHFQQKHSLIFEKIADKNGYKTYSITRWMRRFDKGSGGVTIMVDKQLRSREIRKSKLEDLMWVEVDVGREKIVIGGAYSVPESSSRGRKAEQLVEEIGRDVARFALEGEVMIAGDWNCKIGRLPSVAREKEYVRANTSDRTDSRGRRVMELMDASEMVILNGIRGSVAMPTCEGARGTGVDDYIAVSAGLVENTSNVEYWEEMRDILPSDHCGVMCKMRLRGQRENKNEVKNRERKKKISYHMVGRIKTVSFWARLQEMGRSA